MKSLQIFVSTFLALFAQIAHAQLNPTWFGVWKSDDGHVLQISAKRLTWKDGFQTRHAIFAQNLYDNAVTTEAKKLGLSNEDEFGQFSYIHRDDARGRKQRVLTGPQELHIKFDEWKIRAAEPGDEHYLPNPTITAAAIRNFRPGRYAMVHMDFGTHCDLNGAQMIVDGNQILMFYDGHYSFWAKTYRRIG